MTKIRDGLHGNFVPLGRAVGAVAARVNISDADVEGRRGLNRSGLDDFKTMLDRTVIRNVLSEARAASILFRHLNQPPSLRPSWLDSAIGGFPILDDGVSREGLEMLARWARTETSFRLQGNHWVSSDEPAARVGDLPLPSRLAQIGFDADDLIDFLDANGIAHNLGALGGRQLF